jgi:hypothetical protein
VFQHRDQKIRDQQLVDDKQVCHALVSRFLIGGHAALERASTRDRPSPGRCKPTAVPANSTCAIDVSNWPSRTVITITLRCWTSSTAACCVPMNLSSWVRISSDGFVTHGLDSYITWPVQVFVTPIERNLLRERREKFDDPIRLDRRPARGWIDAMLSLDQIERLNTEYPSQDWASIPDARKASADFAQAGATRVSPSRVG